MNTVRIDAKNVKMIAHRGLSGIETENTCAAFLAAAKRSYFGIETDVRVTADGRFILSHDRSTLRVCGEEYIIDQTEFETLRGISLIDKATGKKQKELTFATPEEYLSICKEYNKHSVIEIKDLFTREQILRLIKLVKEVDWLEHSTFIAFTSENLIMIKEICPNADVQLLVKSIISVDGLIDCLKKDSFGVDAKADSLNAENIKTLRANGIAVNAWTVDDKGIAEELIEAGIDYITTNILEKI